MKNNKKRNSQSQSQLTNVFYVQKRHAKQVKVYLEKHKLLDKSFRLTQVDSSSFYSSRIVRDNDDNYGDNNGGGDDNSNINGNDSFIIKCITIPIVDKCLMIIEQYEQQQQQQQQQQQHQQEVQDQNEDHDEFIKKFIIRIGQQSCLYSSSTLGNTNTKSLLFNFKTETNTCTNMNTKIIDNNGNKNRNVIKQILIDTIITFRKQQNNNHPTNTKHNDDDKIIKIIEKEVDENLSLITCPNKLEIMGDDRTVVLSHKALNMELRHVLNDDDDDIDKGNDNDKNANDNNNLKELIHTFVVDNDHTLPSNNQDNKNQIITSFYTMLWSNIGYVFHSKRIVRRGEIDPNSKIRHSGHCIVWIQEEEDEEKDDIVDINKEEVKQQQEDVMIQNNNDNNEPIQTKTQSTIAQTQSKGWITITEQKIKQSFDLTKVMFSRGNISEKIRFGSIVQKNELVLDMYAGIGYYTLPALIYGHARHVYACEWNPDAIFALKYNLLQNGVFDKATVLEGDSRLSLKEEKLLDVILEVDADEDNDKDKYVGFDRISLGLLPSSEGGWRTAIRALNKKKGGWLHIHGNVPVHEKEQWCFWTCQQLSKLYLEVNHNTRKQKQQLEEQQQQQQQTQPQLDPFVICYHLERVKSFAPKVDHLVADIFVGPILPSELHCLTSSSDVGTDHRIGLMRSKDEFQPCPPIVNTPSCALSAEVFRNQEWMMEKR